MSEVLERRSETLGAAIRLDDGRGLALDRESPGEYVGWTLFLTADFNSIEGAVRDRDVSVIEAIELARDSLDGEDGKNSNRGCDCRDDVSPRGIAFHA